MINSRCLRFELARPISLLPLVFCLLSPGPALAAAPPHAATLDSANFVELTRKSADGDLDQIRKRTFLRVLVVPNKTHFMVDRGRQYGISDELVRDFEKALNKDFPKSRRNTCRSFSFRSIATKFSSGSGKAGATSQWPT